MVVMMKMMVMTMMIDNDDHGSTRSSERGLPRIENRYPWKSVDILARWLAGCWLLAGWLPSRLLASYLLAAGPRWLLAAERLAAGWLVGWLLAGLLARSEKRSSVQKLKSDGNLNYIVT